MKVLIIEDEQKTARELARGLKLEGYEASLAHTGREGLALLQQEVFDLVVLDWMLPEGDGITVLGNLRGQGNRVPVLLLTARDSVDDRVVGLDAGADDYLVKPFALAELLARLRALGRRTVEKDSVLRVANIEVDLINRIALRGGSELLLTEKEFNLLAYLLQHKGRIVTRSMLTRDVWKETGRATSIDNVIDVHIAHLRKKVDLPFGSPLIQTVRGVGYRIQSEEVDA